MNTIVQIDGKRANGASCPPHLTIHNADFIPRIGDLIKFGATYHEVRQIEFEYSMGGKKPHIIHVTTAG
jgi:hypothetical protein